MKEDFLIGGKLNSAMLFKAGERINIFEMMDNGKGRTSTIWDVR